MKTPGSPSHPDRISDLQLGQELGVLIAQQSSSNLPYSVIFSQLQDLLGDDIALLGPMRDLLGRPAFQQLVGLKRHSVQVGARDALLQDLALTYNAGMVVRLAGVIDGCLGHPHSSVPPASQQSTYSTPPSSASPSSFNTRRPPQDSPPAAPNNPTPAAMGHPKGFMAAPRNPDTSLLIALVSMMSGAVLVGLGWLFLGDRLQPGTKSAPSSPPPRESPQPGEIPDNPATPTPSKDLTPAPSVPAPANLPLRADSPSDAQIQALLEAWFDAKASILAGKNSRIPLEVLARPSQVDRLEAERDSDQARGETQTISTAITSLAVDERDGNRVAATVNLRYADQRLNAKGDPQGEPTKLELRNRYVFGRDGGIWRLVSFQKKT